MNPDELLVFFLKRTNTLQKHAGPLVLLRVFLWFISLGQPQKRASLAGCLQAACGPALHQSQN